MFKLSASTIVGLLILICILAAQNRRRFIFMPFVSFSKGHPPNETVCDEPLIAVEMQLDHPKLSTFCYLVVAPLPQQNPHSVLNIVEQGVGHRDDEEGEKC